MPDGILRGMSTFVSLLNHSLLAQTTAPADSSTAAAITQPTAATSAPEQLHEFADGVMRLLGPTFEKTTLYGWLGLLAAILIGLVAGRIISSVLLSVANRLQKRGWMARGAIGRHAAGPVNLAIVTIALAMGLQLIYLTDNLRAISGKIIALLLILAVAWFLYNLVALIDFVLRRMLRRTDPKLVETIVA